MFKCILLIAFINVILAILSQDDWFIYDLELDFDTEYDNKLLIDARTNNNSDLAANNIFVTGSAERVTPLLLLFTTFKVTPERFAINNRTLYNWARLQPSVQLVLFTETATASYLTSRATSLGWAVHVAPQLRSGYPVVPAMFMYCEQMANKSIPFIGYANSDVLFGDDLIETLIFINHVQSNTMPSFGDTAVFVTGKRVTLTRAYYDELIHDAAEGAISAHRSAIHPNNISVPRDGPLSVDYFIASKDTFPWRDVPEFVVGKPGYDNWLVAMAVERRLNVIDVTQTVVAAHIVEDAASKDSGWFSADACINRDLVDPFDYKLGRIVCAPLFTSRDQQTGSRQLFQRSHDALKRARCFSSGLSRFFAKPSLVKHRLSVCAWVAAKKLFFKTLADAIPG